MLNLDDTINFWDNMNQETEEHIYNVIEVLKDYVECKEHGIRRSAMTGTILTSETYS
jgi:hypothetical protein